MPALQSTHFGAEADAWIEKELKRQSKTFTAKDEVVDDAGMTTSSANEWIERQIDKRTKINQDDLKALNPSSLTRFTANYQNPTS
jgi:hypothetical protein